jgi:DNA-binding winged helix-turn-helix (wHTH) protein
MKRDVFFIFLIVLFLTYSSCKQEDFSSEIVKIALRDVGNQLLLSNNDSTSLILPVIKIDSDKYKLSFQKELGFQPDSLVSFVKNSFDKAGLPNQYRVEVLQCELNEVAYSYEMKNDKEESLIPCAGRTLPFNCYTIQIGFERGKKQSSLIYLWLILPVILFLWFIYSQKKKASELSADNPCYKIGNYKFDKDQSKLLYVEKEIGLSKKECELLEILCDNLNDVVKRDELSKRVWEDHGVFVGRSLDTYISKLRKKLKEDASIKITNVHGVGYKLEVQKK